MAEFRFENELGTFSIVETGGEYFVSGNIKAAEKAFREIHRRPPNEHGNFYGREAAGNAACRELIEKKGE